MSNKKSYHITTTDGAAQMNFFTTAKDSKDALNNLIKKSLDFKNLVNKNADITITIKKI